MPNQPTCGSERLQALRPGILEVATDPEFALWPNGRIPYQIVTGGDIPTFSPRLIHAIEEGIENWNKALGGQVRFIPKTHPCDPIRLELADLEKRCADLQEQLDTAPTSIRGEIGARINALNVSIRDARVRLGNCMRLNPSYPHSVNDGFLNIWKIPDGTGGPNWADIGFGRGGQRNMWLHDTENVGVGTVQHELGHVLGLHHEQLRPDRDLYLTVFENTMPSGSYHSDWVQTLAKVGTAIGPYDVNSVMHYWSDWERPNLRVTSTVRDNKGNFIPTIGGTIMETTSHGWAIRIKWDNDVVLERSDPGPLPAGMAYFELSGTWQSNIGVEYFFKQLGHSFSWRAPSLGQQGEGTIEKWTETSGWQLIRRFEDKNRPGKPVEPNWDVISPETAAGVIQMYT